MASRPVARAPSPALRPARPQAAATRSARSPSSSRRPTAYRRSLQGAGGPRRGCARSREAPLRSAVPPGAVRPGFRSMNATSSARRWTATRCDSESSNTSRERSATVAKLVCNSDWVARAVRTRMPRSRARREPSCQSAVLPIPASPSNNNADPPAGNISKNSFQRKELPAPADDLLRHAPHLPGPGTSAQHRTIRRHASIAYPR